MRKTMKNVVVVLVCYLVLRTSCQDYSDSDVEQQCIENCPLQNRTDKRHYGYACDHECNIDQCINGCKLWRQALTVTCQEACNGTSERPTSKDLYCVLGCTDATARHLSRLRARLGTPPAPALLADSLRPDALRLEWRLPAAAQGAGLGCRVQWRYEEDGAGVGAGGWRYCASGAWDARTGVFDVDGLQPYTKYRFRIALTPAAGHLLRHLGGAEPIVSAESVVISTTAAGAPASPPRNVRATPVDATSVTVSWEPGPFPHGPILSYVLNISDTDARTSEVKDISPDNSFIIVRDLRPLKNYTIEIRMRNARSAGPPATVSVSTPEERKINNVEQPPLILGTNTSIVERDNMFEEPTNIYRSKTELKGIGFYYRKQQLFIIDSDGVISKISLQNATVEVIERLQSQKLDFTPLDITVDWLNEHLYILGEVKFQISKYIIKRCNFDGSGLTVAYAGLTKKPSSMQIDPLNGYLFWTVQDFNTGGLFRLDINDISNGIKHEVRIKKILNETELGAFTFEYHNFNILVSYQRLNTIMSVSLDGKELRNIRTSVITTRLEKVRSLAMVNKKFYWTDGTNVFNEEYNEEIKSYYHNTIPQLTNGNYKTVFINLQSFQPWPTPINPPTNVEAIFGGNVAKTRWQAPHLVGLQGKGAWQNWSYEISIKEIITGQTTTHTNITNTYFTITNLMENTEYILKVAAYTNSGRGPWSTDFQGITLNTTKSPVLYWSAAGGLLQSNAAGENVVTVIDRSEMNDCHFVDMAAFKDLIYLVTNKSQVYRYNFTTKQQKLLVGMDAVGSIAVDWIGMQLYWTNLKLQSIFRGNLDGKDEEPLISELAKELNIDSVKAYIYWSTGIKVECARLNGSERYTFHDEGLFSGKQVMGLTLDLEQKYIYWIVRSFEVTILYKAHMQGYWQGRPPTVEEVSSLQKHDIQGPLCYFHKRLLWLQDDKHAAISDVSGKNIATISGNHIQGLNMVYVMDNSSQTLPDADPWLQVNVKPEKVDNNSIKVIGSPSSFNITWNPVQNVNYGDLFYEIKIDDPSNWNDPPKITTTTSLTYWREITPFTPLNVTIKAFTYWASAPRTQTTVYSPSSTPDAPLNLRAFVERQPFPSRPSANVVLRWDPPLHPNGVLQGFKVTCWYTDDDGVDRDLCDNVIVDGVKNEYGQDVATDTVTEYFFTVQAFTKVGLGQRSAPVNVSVSTGRPIPVLLVAQQSSIYLHDIDNNSTVILADDVTDPREVAYLFKEKRLFWLDKKGDFFESNIGEMSTEKLLETRSGAKTMTVDWIQGSLYYSQKIGENKSAVYKIDLNLEPLTGESIFERDASIVDLEMSPFCRSIFWIETTEGTGYVLMKSDADGSNVKPFFTEHNESAGSVCNCPSQPAIGASFAIDHSDDNMRPKLSFIDGSTKNVTWADQNGCRCGVVADSSDGMVEVGGLEVDSNSVYWMDKDGIHGLLKKEGRYIGVNVTKQNGISDMKIYGEHMQPYPSEKCLRVESGTYSISRTSPSANSLTLEMPQPIVDPECSNISMPTMKYTIFYSEYTRAFESCEGSSFRTLNTSNSTQEISGLKPYTKYSVCVSVRNHFSKDDDVVIGPPSILQTAPGVPSEPRNVTATVLSPNLAVVSWQPPAELNGVTAVKYEIHWQTESAPSGVRQKGELSIIDSEALHTYLQKLSPNETYTIWVRVYGAKHESWNDSDRVHITTYPEPTPLELRNRTAYTMELSWEPTSHIEKYEIEFATITTNDWLDIKNVQLKNRSAVIEVDNLKTKTQYKFRLKLWYEGNEEAYVWPTDFRFTFETLGDRPSPPGIPIIQYVKPNKVIWEASKDNGAPIEMYKLEGKILRFYRNKRSMNRSVPFDNIAPSVELEDPDKWETFYNGTNTSWIMDGLDEKQKYAFRVSALNSYGWSDPSEESNEFDPMAARMAEKQSPMKLILIATLVPISICAIFILIFVYLICSGKRSKQKKLQQVALSVPRAPDVELATLRELPRRGIHNTNLLYVSTQPSPEEFSILPQIKREQITLTKFLGSGAFGEVFEGKAKGINNDEIDTRVAVKTLKKGASDQEKSEFLQEAQLMSHFKHEHILQLLGVCLDNDPHFIIMELMEGGDLLTYLRDSRNISTNTPSLTLIELLKMCVDVSKGCRYLEEMHFVHRDLACRNCLVSSYDSESRIVKIGDFGLARDIYKNDYYRKEGEGLLPVRWMAPESLVDGVFTSQSDVWAFGVLLWEIMTLGQQPYPARANLEVLHYVRRGGRLGKPIDCPDELHSLMLNCWAFDPEERPTFKYCFEELENVHRKTLRNPTTAAHEGQYISTIPDMLAGVSNEAYFRDENHNSSGNSWRSDNEDEANKEKTPFLDKEGNEGEKEIPKYLELIYEPRPALENDGYEIPNQMIDKFEEKSTCNKPNGSADLK